MGVKSSFLNDYIMEEVYVKQPSSFENEKFSNHVYKLSRVLYGLKQAPGAWYDRLKNFLLDNDFLLGKAETTLFVKRKNQDILIVQIYVDDIIFDYTNEFMCKEFSFCMSKEFEMSMMGELKNFLRLQIKQYEVRIFINQAKYVKDLLKRFGYDNWTAKSTPISTTIKLDKDEKGKEVDIKTYRGMIGSLLYLICLLLYRFMLHELNDLICLLLYGFMFHELNGLLKNFESQNDSKIDQFLK